MREIINLVETPNEVKLTKTFLNKVRAAFNHIDSSSRLPDTDAKLAEQITELLDEIEAQEGPLGDNMIVTRAELRPRQTLPNGIVSLGCHWCWGDGADTVYHHDNAYDRWAADGFDKDDLAQVTLNAEVKFSDIDWPFTIATNLRLPDEHEITIRSGAIIVLNEIFWDDGSAVVDKNVRVTA